MDVTPPVLSLAATPDTLWPPNHELYCIGLSVSVDDCDINSGSFTNTLVEVWCDEPEGDAGLRGRTYNFAPDAAFIERDQHTWVQAEIDGVWRDFDSAFAGSKPGVAIGRVIETVDNPAEHARHTVTIRIIAETIDITGELSEKVLLNKRLNAASAAESQVFVSFTPTDANRGTGGAVYTIGRNEVI